MTRYYRLRFLSLWLSQFAAIAADNCLRQFVIGWLSLRLEWSAAAHVVTVIFLLPYILLAPLNGALANSLPKSWVLVGSAAGRMAVPALLGGAALLTGAAPTSMLWLVAVAVSAVGAAIYSPARYAILPAAAEDCKLPLSRINGFIEMGILVAMLGGMVLGGFLTQQSELLLPIVFGLYLVATVAAGVVKFPSDVRRAEPLHQAARTFMADARTTLAVDTTRHLVLGLALFWALATAITNSLYGYAVEELARTPRQATDLLVLIGAGVAGGSLVAGLVRHPRRLLGWIPFGGVSLAAATFWLSGSNNPWLPALLAGFAGGLIDVPLNTSYQANVPAAARGNAMAVANAVNYLAMAAISILMAALGSLWLRPAHQLILLGLIAAAGAIYSWRRLLREALELFVATLGGGMYRIRAIGPGVDQFPLSGPVLVIANHAAWFDPMWLGKVIPRRIIPMMGSEFYDLPIINWLMRRVIRAIRVQQSRYRYEVPELDEAVRRLDQGECLTVFPEGWVRRKEEQLLRQFGQGVWRILRDRPLTPVVCCWIEGNWGSFTSHKNGPPGKGKRFDCFRPITIVMAAPEVVPASILQEHRRTRQYLMEQVLCLRKHLPNSFNP